MADPTDLPVHEQIFARARSHPHATAALCGQQALSYADLAAGAGLLARRLLAAGVRPDQVVGLTGPRCLDGLIGMVGILAAGGAYLYLDPQLPAARLRYLLDETTTAIVVTVGGQPAPAGRRGVVAGRAASARYQPDLPCPGRAGLGDLAYVVYTSGSTGLPKGVAVEHRGVATMTRQLAVVFAVGAGTRMLQFASWSWDASVCEILVPLTAGGTVVLADDDLRTDPAALAALIRARRVEVATLTPSVLAVLPTAEMATLRTVVAVGETCPPQVIDRWWTPDRRVLNGYGPTEATVAVAVGECRPGAPVHIGAPLAEVQVRVIDEYGRPVAAGQPGELHVAGPGLARGYLTRPSTADGGPVADDGGRFCVDTHGRRWLHTGDRVRQLPDGTLQHLGRVDDQIQLHGHRVELGEVEATLRACPGVAQCAATVYAGRLVGYLVPEPDTDAGDLLTRAAAAARSWLPAALVPHLCVLSTLPLSDNGKLDRSALPDPAHLTPPSPVVAVPQDPTVADVLDVLRPLLGTIGAHDNVFDHGGHSLLAAQISVAISARFGVDLPALTVVAHPSAAQLAGDIRGGVDAPVGPGSLAGTP